MRRQVIGLVLGLVATAGWAQTATRTTVILGAGRAGTWDTEISVTNTDFRALDVLITGQFDRSPCGLQACNDFAEATVAPFGTLVVPSLSRPDAPALSDVPQALYVFSASNQKPPAVSATAYDTTSSCGRIVTLQVLPLDEAFNAGDLYFPGASRSTGRYANLIVTLDPRASAPQDVGVAVADGQGNMLFVNRYEIAPGATLFVKDVIAALGVDSVENGSIHLSRFFLPHSFDFTPYAATVTLLEPGRVHVVTGRRDRIALPGLH